MLTSASCVSKIKAIFGKITVRLGDWDIKTNPDCDTSFISDEICNDPYVDIPVEETILHADFNETAALNDIALLRLSKYVKYTKFIKPICLPLDSTLRKLDLSGKTLDVVGWGGSRFARVKYF